MSAIRLARGFTGRDVVVKFAGCYHGHVDSLLASAGSGLATFAVPGTPGVPAASTAADAGAALQRPGRGRAGVRRARRPDRLPDHRGRPRQHGRRPAGAGLQPASSPRPARAHGALFVSDEVMTGFRVTRSGPVGPRRRRRGLGARPDDLRQGDGRRLPGRGVRRPRRRDVDALAGGAGLPGRHAVGEPGRHHRRAGHAAAGHRRGLRPPRHGRAGGPARPPPPRWPRPACRTSSSTRQHVLRVLHRRGRHRGPRLRRRDRAAPASATPRSSTRCSTRASTCRRGVRGVVPLRGPRRPRASDRMLDRPARTPPAPRPPSTHRGSPMSDRDTIVHLLRHGEVHNPEGVLYGRLRRLPPLRARPADGRAGRRHRSPTATSPTCVASPLERAQETARPAGARPAASRSSPTRG